MKNKLLFFTLLLMASFLFTKSALAWQICTFDNGSKNCEDAVYQSQHPQVPCSGVNYATLDECKKFESGQTIFWYICPVAGANKVYTCENTKISSSCSNPLNTIDSCKGAVAKIGTLQQPGSPKVDSAAAAKAKADAQAQAAADAAAAKEQQAQQDAAKKALLADQKKAKNLHCSCNELSPDLQCKDGFNSMQEVNDACNSCYAEFGNSAPTNVPPQEGPCPLGTKLNGTFSCTCGSGDKESCVPYYTFAELKAFCPATCVPASGECKSATLESLKKLQKDALILNPGGFALGTAGIREIVGKMIIFLVWPIGMFSMALYIWAGFLWMTSQGGENITKAKSIITWTTLGVAATLSSYLLVQFVFSSLF